VENILQILEKNRCSGCGICAGICPSKAIKMVIEENIGFYRPLVDENKCTDCGKCLQICPFADNNYKEINSKEELFGNVLKVYSGWAKDENTRYKSASGGIATALSLEMMDKGYFIGGTAYQKDNSIRTESFIAKNEEDVHRFISSKYIPSEYSKVVREIIKNKRNKYVIIGLPCQIAALRNIFGYKNENIILIDILCGRMESIKLIEKYVQHFSIGNLKYINFRDKKTTWYKHSITCRSENNEVSESFGDSLFGRFLNNYLFTQDSCLLCYNPAGRESDITLGNFWNKEKFGNERNGVSLIITRTDKGEELIKNMKSIRINEENKEELFITQPHFLLALDKKKREKLVIKNRKLLEEADKYDLVCLNKKYNEKTLFEKAKSKVRKSIVKIFNKQSNSRFSSFHKNIHIGGPMYGAHNIGDEAILTSMINSFSEKNNISVSTYDNERLKVKYPFVVNRSIYNCFSKPFFGLYISPRKNPIKAFINLKREKEFYSKKDLYICGGATILSDCPWYSLRTIDIALKAGAKTILFGVGMAEIKDKSAIPFIKKICNKLEDIYVRDNFVKRRLENIGIEANKIKICYDSALILNPSENFKVEKYLNNEQIEKYYNHYTNIGITLSGERDIINRSPINDIKKIIKFLIKKYNANIFLVPTNTRKGMDIDLMEKLLGDENISLIEQEFSPEDLIAFMKNFSFVISSRLHMNILSSIVGTPSIGLVRNSKIIDFAKLLGLKYFSIENLNIQDLERYCDELIDKNDNLQKEILRRVNKMRDIHLKTVIKIKRKYNF